MKKMVQFILAVAVIVAMAMFACSCSSSSITSAIMDNTSKLQTPDGTYLDEDKFDLPESIENYKTKGYKRIKIQLKVALKEVDNCYQYFKLYNNCVIIKSTKASHGGSAKNTSWEDHYWNIDLSLSDFESDSFKFRCQAENALFKYFFIGNVSVQITVYTD